MGQVDFSGLFFVSLLGYHVQSKIIILILRVLRIHRPNFLDFLSLTECEFVCQCVVDYS